MTTGSRDPIGGKTEVQVRGVRDETEDHQAVGDATSEASGTLRLERPWHPAFRDGVADLLRCQERVLGQLDQGEPLRLGDAACGRAHRPAFIRR